MLHHSPEVDAELYDEGRPQEGGLDRTVSLIRPTACYYVVMNFEEHRRGHTIRGCTEVERRGKGGERGYDGSRVRGRQPAVWSSACSALHGERRRRRARLAHERLAEVGLLAAATAAAAAERAPTDREAARDVLLAGEGADAGEAEAVASVLAARDAGARQPVLV